MRGFRWHIGGPTPCKVCQARDGKLFEGEFEEAHPNCVCWPEYLEVERGPDGNLREVSDIERDVPLQKGSSKGLKVCFVAASPSQVDVMRKAPLTGEEGLAFKRAVLEPLGLNKAEVGITYLVPRHMRVRGRSRPPRHEEIEAARPALMKDLQQIGPQIIVALGKQASDALGMYADFSLPHPGALAKAPVQKELGRKVQAIGRRMRKAEESFYSQKLFLLPERRATLIKAAPKDEEKRLVYAIVLEPGVPDGEGDIFSAELIEKLAHEYAASFRQFQNWHSGQKFEAELVENEIAKTDYEWQGQKIKKGSWVVCIHILSDWMWRLVKSGIYLGISVGGGYVHVERVQNI